jgi:hypothetical protein
MTLSVTWPTDHGDDDVWGPELIAGLNAMIAAINANTADIADEATRAEGAEALASQCFTGTFESPIVAGVGTTRIPVPFNCTLVSVTLTADTAPSGGSWIVDVNYSADPDAAAATIFGTQSHRPTVLSGDHQATAGAASVTTFAAGGYWTFDPDLVNSADEATILLVVKRTA